MSRDEIIYKVIDACHEKKLNFGSFYAYLGRYIVLAHDLKTAGIKPKLEECRDMTDYQLAMDAWHKRGMVMLAVDDDPIGALQSALEYLEKL